MHKSSVIESRRIRLSDIATRVGLSRSAVAEVLLHSAGNNVRVSKDAAQRIRHAADELGYVPNQAAQRLAGKESRLIGVLIDSYAPVPRFRQLAEIERAADAAGYRIIIGQSHGELAKIQSYLDDFVANDVAGLVCISHDYPDIGEEISRRTRLVANTVFLGRPLGSAAHCAFVAIDHARATADLVDHMFANGRRSPVFLTTDLDYATSRIRHDSFLRAMRRHGIRNPESRIELVRNDLLWTGEALHPDLLSLVRDKIAASGADAVLAINDIVALRCLRALETIGMRVPEDIALAGYDNSDFTAVIRPSLTSVDLHPERIAAEGFALLLRLIRGEKPSARERHVFLPTQLVPRRSTLPPG